jgi:hypothetical protein
MLVCIAIVAGLVVGYVGLGHRGLTEVFELKTWKHVYDLVFG